MNISSVIELFQTPTCIILAFAFLVLICGFVFNNLHISSKNLEIDAKTKKKKKKSKK